MQEVHPKRSVIYSTRKQNISLIMKYNHCLALIGLSTLMLTACEPDTPSEPILEAYPKKHLIEEFTGQDCGYCPYGMNCIHEFMGNDTNWVLVLHHYGYQKDHFSVSGSQTITKALKVGRSSECNHQPRQNQIQRRGRAQPQRHGFPPCVHGNSR